MEIILELYVPKIFGLATIYNYYCQEIAHLPLQQMGEFSPNKCAQQQVRQAHQDMLEICTRRTCKEISWQMPLFLQSLSQFHLTKSKVRKRSQSTLTVLLALMVNLTLLALMS